MTLEEKFVRAEISGQDGVFERIDDTHPVGIFLGLEGRLWAIMVICSKRPPQPPSLASIAVEVRSRQTREWALVLRLSRPELKGLFIRLVEDLDTATRQRPDDPGAVVIARLAHWQHLFSRGASTVLDDDHLRGLMGELEFLVNEAITTFGPRCAVASWVGPFGAAKDFSFPAAEIEVKAIHPSRDRIAIASLEQLSDAGLPLFLWSRIVVLSTIQPGGENSLPEFVARVRHAVSDDSEAVQRLEQCLLAAGWEDRTEYESRGVEFGSMACYAVCGEFPRLQRGTTARAIEACRYEIAIGDLLPFKVSTWRGVQDNGR